MLTHDLMYILRGHNRIMLKGSCSNKFEVSVRKMSDPVFCRNLYDDII